MERLSGSARVDLRHDISSSTGTTMTIGQEYAFNQNDVAPGVVIIGTNGATYKFKLYK